MEFDKKYPKIVAWAEEVFGYNSWIFLAQIEVAMLYDKLSTDENEALQTLKDVYDQKKQRNETFLSECHKRARECTLEELREIHAMCVDDNEEAAAAIFLAEINRREAREAEIRYWEKKA